MEGEQKSALSFGFAKKKETKVLKKAAIEDEEKTVEEETDFVSSFDKNELKSLKPKEEKKELVIPLIETNRWRHARKPEELEQEPEVKRKTETAEDIREKTDDESLAVRELLQDAAARSEEWETRGDTKDKGMVVPLLMQNKVPEGFETDDKLDVQLRPDEANDADYDAVPIDQYGLAMLRGMGWNLSEGIGKTVKGTVRPVEAIPRPKGLGLGADRSLARQKEHASGGGGEGQEEGAEKEKLKLKAGTHCQVISGKHNDLYGIIQGLDEENSRAVVKLAVGSETISINQMALKLVTEKEYNKYSKYLNKGKVDKFKEKQNKKSSRDSDSESHRKQRHHHHDNGHHRDRKHKHRDSESSEHSDYSDSDKHSDKHKRSDKHDKHKHDKHARRDRERDLAHRDSDREDRERRKDKKRKHEETDRRSDKKHKTPSHVTSGSSPWLRPHLRVRVVDPQYNKGKYFKVKVTIEDVISLEECICRTDEGKVLEGLTEDQLETVIPKSDPGYVMVVSGKHKGQVGEILKKDKSACVATVQLLGDRDALLKLDYDVICEYVGDIQSQFDY